MQLLIVFLAVCISVISTEGLMPERCPESVNFNPICKYKRYSCLSNSQCSNVLDERCCRYSCGSKCFKKFPDTELPRCWQGLNKGHPCRRYISSPVNRWYYDKSKRQCVKFEYRGCGGNENNFKSKRDCLLDCGSKYVPGSMLTGPNRPPWDRIPETIRI